MASSIPANAIVQVTPSVLSAGGTALDLNGLIITQSVRVPVGTVPGFPSAAAVAAYFGPTSTEAALASVYFQGFTISNRKPGQLLFVQSPLGPVAAYVRGGNVSALSVAYLQSINGPLSITVDGVAKNVTVNLSAATSFSAAAALIGTALGVGCNFDAVVGAFAITSTTLGPASTISYPSGTVAGALALTAAQGAVASQGAGPGNPTVVMNTVVAATRNWCSVMTAFEPSLAAKIEFAGWVNAQASDYLYVCWDTDITATQPNTTGHAGYLIGPKGANSTGTAMVYQDPFVAAFLMGAVASLDFGQNNGRATMAFRGQSGLTPTVTDATTSANLTANGYNFYGAYGTAHDQFVFFYPGSVTGPFLWIDSYVDEIWMTNQFQLALMVLLTNVKSVPYNALGYSLIRAACTDVINQALRFGAIRAGVTLSQFQAAAVNAQAGLPIDSTLSSVGWYLQVLDPTPQVRAARGTPQCTFFYTDGQSVQSINLATVEIQ